MNITHTPCCHADGQYKEHNKGCHLSQLPEVNKPERQAHVHVHIYTRREVNLSRSQFPSTRSIDMVNNSCNCVQITELASVHLNAFPVMFSFQLNRPKWIRGAIRAVERSRMSNKSAE